MPRGQFDRKKLKPAGEYKLDSAMSAKVEEMIAHADLEIEETRVNFRWGKDQLNLVKRAARLIGVPYQTYIKQVLFKQCLADLKAASELLD